VGDAAGHSQRHQYKYRNEKGTAHRNGSLAGERWWSGKCARSCAPGPAFAPWEPP
jgi:hypothetical protein